MELIYRAASNFALCIVILLAYQKILSDKTIKRSSFICLPLCFSAYMFITYFLIEPLRTIGGLFILGLFLRILQRKVNLAALALSFLCGYFLWIISLVLVAPISMLLFSDFNEWVGLILIFIEIIVYFSAYKLLSFKNGIPHINDSEVKSIIFLALGVILSVWGIFYLSYIQAYEINPPLVMAGFIVLAFVILGCGVFIIHHAKRHRERLALEKKAQSLKEENHSYSEVAPAVRWTNALLLDKIKEVTEQGDLEKLQEMKQYLSLVGEFSTELSEELSLDDLVKEYRGFSLPAEWLPLKTKIVLTLAECERKEYLAFAKNTATTWEQIQVPKVKFIRLVGNLLKNAVRELEKTRTDEKEILIRFYDENEFFAVEVFDTAHAFPVPVLARLGERGNSTNGTGDGYAEIFEFLAESGASLIITEQAEDGKDTKAIRILFDGKERLVVCSDSRYEELKTALAETRFEVERLA